MSKPISWSFSALDSFETCPKRHYVVKVARLITEPQGEALLWGHKVHKALEDRINGIAALPQDLQHHESFVQKLLQPEGQRLVETQMTIDANFNPCGWRDKQAWCRGKVDFGIVKPKVAIAVDWKTGKRKPESDQMKLMAALMFAHFPFLERITTIFAWLKEKKLDQDVFTSTQKSTIWSDFLQRVKRLEHAHQTGQWDPKPSGLCGKWCPVTKAHCQFGK
jgi:hypothetical protein